MPDVIVILGSPADTPWSDRIVEALNGFGVVSEVRVASAHKTPERLLRLLRQHESTKQAHVYITVAGRSNALSGFVDAAVAVPVIACPPAHPEGHDPFGGMDILSSLRMPRGVAPLVVLEPENAALAAVKMLALTSERLRGEVGMAQEAERERVESADMAVYVQDSEAAHEDA